MPASLANRSYGLQVAKLAGIPAAVLSQARDKLAELEGGNVGLPSAPTPAQDDLFAMPGPHPVLEELQDLEVDNLSPRQALDILYRLREKLD